MLLSPLDSQGKYVVPLVACRIGRGGIIKSKQPAKPLTLYGYEASPFVKVRWITCQGKQLVARAKPLLVRRAQR